MHYWVPARKAERCIPDINAHFLIKNVQKKLYKVSLRDLKDVRSKLKRYDIEKGRENSYLEEFIKDDPDKIGKVTVLAFLFIMTNKFKVS